MQGGCAMPKDSDPAKTLEIPQNVIDFIGKCSTIIKNYDFIKVYWSIIDSCRFGHNNTVFTSPIENILFSSIITICWLNDFIKSNDIYIDKENKLFILRDSIISIYPQYEVGLYRIDFKIIYKKDTVEKSVFIECDSQEFHERTKEERQYEKERDRYFSKQGLTVLHFTGSEIVKKPFIVASEIISYLTEIDINKLDKTSMFI